MPSPSNSWKTAGFGSVLNEVANIRKENTQAKGKKKRNKTLFVNRTNSNSNSNNSMEYNSYFDSGNTII